MEQQETQTNAKKVLSLTLTQDEREKVENLASEREWSVAKTGGWLLRLGLQKLNEQRAQKPEQAVAA